MTKKVIRERLDYAFLLKMCAVIKDSNNKRQCSALLNECSGILYSALFLQVISADDHKTISEILTNLMFGDMHLEER